MRRVVVALAYAGLVGWHFLSYYLDVRSAPADTIIDYTFAFILFGPISFLTGLLIARWWAVILPLVAFPFTAMMLVVAEFDDRYAQLARDRGGELGAEWLGLAALFCYFAVPGAALGAGLGEAVRRRGRR